MSMDHKELLPKNLFRWYWGKLWNATNVLVGLEVMLCIQEVFVLNLGWGTGYLDRGFSCFLLVHPGKYQGRSPIRPRPLPSKSFPVRLSSYNPTPYSLDAVASLNSPREKENRHYIWYKWSCKEKNLAMFLHFLKINWEQKLEIFKPAGIFLWITEKGKWKHRALRQLLRLVCVHTP
jgi:hypothetical protein